MATPPNHASRADSLVFFRFFLSHVANCCQFSGNKRTSANIWPTIAHRPVQRKQGLQVLSGWLQSQWQAKADLLQGPSRSRSETHRACQAAKKRGSRRARYSSRPQSIGGESARRLAPFNKSVLDAAEFYASHLERESSSIHVSEAVEDYLNSKVRAGFSKRHLRDIRGRIGRFSKFFGERLIKTVTSVKLRIGSTAYPLVHRALSIIARWCMRFLNIASNGGWSKPIRSQRMTKSSWLIKRRKSKDARSLGGAPTENRSRDWNGALDACRHMTPR